MLDPGPQLHSSVCLAKSLNFPELQFQSKIQLLVVQCTQVNCSINVHFPLCLPFADETVRIEMPRNYLCI